MSRKGGKKPQVLPHPWVGMRKWAQEQNFSQHGEVTLPKRTKEEESFYNHSAEIENSKTTSNKNSALPDLSSASFLKNIGYDTNTTWDKRREILEVAAMKFGKRKILKHLNFLVDMRTAQKNGMSKFAHAIEIWEHDINYIQNKTDMK